MRTAERIIGGPLASISQLYDRHIIRRANSIAKDTFHPSHALFSLLPPGRRFRSIKTVTTRHCKSFSPKQSEPSTHYHKTTDIHIHLYKHLTILIKRLKNNKTSTNPLQTGPGNNMLICTLSHIILNTHLNYIIFAHFAFCTSLSCLDNNLKLVFNTYCTFHFVLSQSCLCLSYS